MRILVNQTVIEIRQADITGKAIAAIVSAVKILETINESIIKGE